MYSPKWSRVTRITVAIICLIIIIALIILALPLFEALAISALLAYLLNPAVKYLTAPTPAEIMGCRNRLCG